MRSKICAGAGLRWMTLVLLVVLMTLSGCKRADKGYRKMASETKSEEQIALNQRDPAIEFQADLNAQFADPEDSPLTEEDRLEFTELEFFPIDEAFRVRARLERAVDSQPFAMKTTTDRLPIYKLYATAHFELEGKALTLELYQNQDLIGDPEHSDYLFLPYTDLTNGDSSYGGGRFINLSIPEGNEITIDFNQSYNPYCAYNPKYSCPIPPAANRLDVAIEAGVKAYGEHH